MQTNNARADLSRLPVMILGAALVLGVLGDLLLRRGPLGLNVLMWVVALVVALIALARACHVPFAGDGRWLLVPALLFAGAVALRASPTMQALNVAAVLLTLALAAFRLREGRIRVGHVSEYAWALIVSASSLAAGTVMLLARHMPWRSVAREGRRPAALSVVRGLLVAVPLLAVFGGLFVAADAVFSNAVTAPFRLDLAGAGWHLFWFVTWSWVAASVLWQCLLEPTIETPAVAPRPAFRLGPIEIGTVLGLLDLLFLVFVVIQVRYLFGGAGHVEATTDLTYAEYARRGFFELLAVAALVLPVILGIHWLLRDSSRSLKLAFRLLATGLVLLVFVVISSAVKRMDAYVDQFGLTELRLYTTAFMAWLALVFVWLLATVIHGRRERFAFGAATAGFFVLAGLNLLNPDAFMADTNLDRAADGAEFDVGHAASLSADATPTLIAGLAALPPAERCEVASAVRRDGRAPDSWRTWNYGRAQARDSVAGAADALAAACR